MINYYIRDSKGKIRENEVIESGCWINMTNPTEQEVQQISSFFEIDEDFLKAALDEEESGRVVVEDGVTFILLDMPYAQKNANNIVLYYTIPVGIIILREHIITVCLKDGTVLNDFTSGLAKNINPSYKTRFSLQMLYSISVRYMQYLKQIDKISDYIEKKLYKSTENKELIQLLDLQKSLVYLSTSLKATEVLLQKIERGRILKLYDEDQELLDDVIVEYRQAREMADIYSSILTGTMDAFASVISNNVNDIMKKLTYLTILLSIPTIVSSFYGMNVMGIPLAGSFWIPVLISAIIAGILLIIFIKKKML